MGFEPMQLMLPGLKSGSLDHSDISAKISYIYNYTQLYNIYNYFFKLYYFKELR